MDTTQASQDDVARHPADPQQLVDAVRRDQPDVLVLTELTPLTDQRQIPGTRYTALVGTLTVDGHPVTIAGVHPNAPTALALWQSDYRILTQALDPHAATAGGRGHEVVTGDFNAAVTNGPLARLLRTGLQDAALAARVPIARGSAPARPGRPTTGSRP